MVERGDDSKRVTRRGVVVDGRLIDGRHGGTDQWPQPVEAAPDLALGDIMSTIQSTDADPSHRERFGDGNDMERDEVAGMSGVADQL